MQHLPRARETPLTSSLRNSTEIPLNVWADLVDWFNTVYNEKNSCDETRIEGTEKINKNKSFDKIQKIESLFKF